ncbi:hypothetical protein [Streptomyces sp. NPDC000229]|uniref:hypothetical protein n=1 Tax=Streptomyces sp. NPDC000229 TaxID=3154247 RepID=UPI00332ECA5A
MDLQRHLDWYAGEGPDGLLFVGGEKGAVPPASFGRKRRRDRGEVGKPENFRFCDLRHGGRTLSTRSGATLKGTMVRAGQSTEKATLIYRRSDHDRRKEGAGGAEVLRGT